MAAYRKRGANWRVEVSVSGRRASGTFSTKREAQAWAAREETRLRESTGEEPPDLPFRDLLERSSREVSARKRGYARERNMVNVLLGIRSRTRRCGPSRRGILLLGGTGG